MSSNPVRQTAIAAFNSRLNAANTRLYNSQVAIGLDLSGNYVVDSNANYIASATTVKEAIHEVDLMLYSVATTYAPTEYVNSSIAGLVNSAPEILDTLGEISAALGADAQLSVTLSTQISNETARARLAESGLRTDLSGEIVRATTAEAQLRTDLSGEIIRSLAAELLLRTDLSGEIVRATAAEGVLSTMIATEVLNRTEALSTLSASADSRISDLSGSLHAGLEAEVIRAQAAETVITQALTNEISRATTTDTQLRTDLSGEIVRATAAELQLRTDLSGEIVRATAAETALDGRTTAIEETYIKKDGSVAFIGNMDMSGNKLVNVLTPTADTDASNKVYVDTLIAALGSVFEYVGTLDPGVTASLDTLTKKETGDYYRIIAKGSVTFTAADSSTKTLTVNIGDGVIKNGQGGWDLVDNTDPTIAGTAGRLTVTGNTNDGYTFDIASTYVGQASINTVGTVTTGEWQATTVATAYGGSGQTTYATGDLLVGDLSGSLQKLALGAAGTVLRSEAGAPQWIVADTAHVAVTDTTNFGNNSNVQLALDYLFNFTQTRKVAQHVITSSTDYADADAPNAALLAGKVNFINYDSSSTDIYLPPASAGLVNGTVFRLVHNGVFTDGNLVVKYKDASSTVQGVLELAPRDSIALVWNEAASSYLFAVGI